MPWGVGSLAGSYKHVSGHRRLANGSNGWVGYIMELVDWDPSGLGSERVSIPWELVQ